MAELKDKAEELQNELRALAPSFNGLGRDIRSASKKLDRIQASAAYKKAAARNAIEDRMSSMMATLERYQKFAEARNTMTANQGMFKTERQAEAYNEAKKAIANPQQAAQEREERMYGTAGANELRKMRADERFRRDTMSDSDREREMWKDRYGGDADMAEKKMRHDALRNLPEFFKNTKLSARDLRQISKSAAHIPGLNSLMRGFADFKDGGGLKGVGGWAAAIVQGVKLGIAGIKANLEIGADNTATGARARRGGMDPTEFRAWSDVMAATGGSGESALALSKSWKTNVGALLSGRGGSEFLSTLATYGIDISGSGAGGIANYKQMTSRVSGRIKELRESGEEERAMALARDAGFDEHMYDAAIRYGKRVNRPKEFYRDVEARIQSGEDTQYTEALGVRWMERHAEALKRGFYKALTLDMEQFNGASKLDTIYDDAEQDRLKFMRQSAAFKEQGAKGYSVPPGFNEGGYNVPESVAIAANSSDQYDKGAFGDKVADGNKVTEVNKTGNFVFNVSQVSVAANNAEDFARSMATDGAQRSRVAVAQIFDPVLT